MSKRLSDEQYEKTLSFRLKQWLDGSKVPYLGEVEMKPQSLQKETVKEQKKREKEKKKLFRDIYDMEQNARVRIFNRIYKIFSVMFCVFFIILMISAVADMPRIGRSDNPANN